MRVGGRGVLINYVNIAFILNVMVAVYLYKDV